MADTKSTPLTYPDGGKPGSKSPGPVSSPLDKGQIPKSGGN